MNEAKVLDLIGKYLTGNIAPAERRLLMSWVEENEANRAFFDEMIQLWSVSARYEAPIEADLEAAWEKVEARTKEGSEGGGNPGRIIGLPRRWLLRVAAVLLLGVLAGYWLWRTPLTGAPPVIVQTGAGETRQIELPDGSAVWLNEQSELRYSEPFEERRVNLAGEAFFDIRDREGDPFEVRSGPARTVVLGTRFNVRAYPEEERIEVAVQSGKVALEAARQPEKKVLLTAGQAGVYRKKEQEVDTLAGQSPNADAWKEQRLVFDSTPVRTVIRDLERYFGIRIEVTDERVLACLFSASMPFVQPELAEVLTTMELALDVQIEATEANRYLIKGAGCATGEQ